MLTHAPKRLFRESYDRALGQDSISLSLISRAMGT